MSLPWGLYTNLVESTKFHLTTKISDDGIVDYEGNSIVVDVARKKDDNWTIPRITILYSQENDLGQPFLGNTIRDDRHLLIFDIYAVDEPQRLDLAKWLRDKLIDGWRYYSYVTNPSDRDNPTKTAGGLINLDTILSNNKAFENVNVSEIDSHRHRISVTVWIGV